jgi:hypothetical protein
MSTTITAYLTLTGHGVDPAEITRALGITPDKIWREGESIQRTLLKSKDDAWSIQVKREGALAAGDVVHALLERTKPFAPKVRELAIRLNLSVEIACDIATDTQPVPVLHFDQEILSTLNELGAELDIDLYLIE